MHTFEDNKILDLSWLLLQYFTYVLNFLKTKKGHMWKGHIKRKKGSSKKGARGYIF